MIAPLGAAASIVNDAVTLFTCQPVVRTVRRCDHVLIAVRAITHVSDLQGVFSDPVPPMRDGMLKSADPTLIPTIVTLIAPDAATFAIVALLGPPASIVSDAVKLFICQPVVMTVVRRDLMLIADFAVTQLIDRHAVIVARVPPMRDGLL